MKELSPELWVSLLIVSHNDGKWLSRCLESIRAQTVFDNIEIIIADNASEDKSDELAKRLIAGWTNARFLATGGDRGFCVGLNSAAREARGKYLYALNPDTWLEKNCVGELFNTAERESAGAVGPTILNYADDSLQSECPAGFDFCGNLMLPPKNRRARHPFSAGGFFFIRREVFMRLGLLDEKFFMYCEEQDLAWRLWISGEKVVPAPSARIHHQGAVGLDAAGAPTLPHNRTSVQKRFLANRNRLLVLAKNCQHVLLLMMFPGMLLVILEGMATWAATRSLALAQAGCFSALTDLWRLRGHILEQRRRMASLRQHGDLWMLRFFRLGFGRWDEIAKILSRGFPRISR